jgi:hypothetical protein
VYPVTGAAAVVQATPLAKSFNLFVLANPVPVNCTWQFTVNGHIPACVSGPCNVNTPTSNEKSVLSTDVSGLFDQHKRYRTPDVPSVVSPAATAYTSY